MKLNLTKMQMLTIFALLMISKLITAQSLSPIEISQRHIVEQAPTWGLTTEDISDLRISDSHISSISGVAHIYYQQRFQGIAVENAIINLSIAPNGKVIHVGNRLVKNLTAKVNKTSPAINAELALTNTINHLQLDPVKSFNRIESKKANEVLFEKGTFANSPVATTLTYVVDENEAVNLVWRVALNPISDVNYWYSYVDATSGDIIQKQNLTIKCAHTDLSVQGKQHSTCTDHSHHYQTSNTASSATANSTVTNSYRVFPIPTESPLYGNHQLIFNPADAVASPIGWHDDGTTQYSITRGNNVYAYLDIDGNGMADAPGPNGGPNLDFDFPYNPNDEPSDMQAAAQINLFYMSNVMHDVTYQYGFDEAAGNFQNDNFANGGQENDVVIARAQQGALLNDPEFINNANFSTLPDGQPGTMNMYLWDSNYGNGLLQVEEPSNIAGTYNTIQANFGPDITTTPITAEAVVVDDGVYDQLNTDGCEMDFVNADDLDGKIAIIDRGGCIFEGKVINAENNGAIAVIVCNFDDDPILMGPSPDVGTPTIPSVMIGASDCQTIRQYSGDGLMITLVQPTATGPDEIDGDFDNGVIAHEYSHGVSQRLTGGGSLVSCLSNREQMGEGWSDFISMALTATSNDVGTDPRGIGNYVVRLPEDGKGIRRYPYSTDMNISPLTYDDVPGVSLTPNGEPSEHAIGEIWANMLWDLYWALVDEYGWDADIYNGTGGNNMALQLVFEGMKMQPCSPGFEDGRDAILDADEALFNGANQCLIWEVFARRGLGYYASQGSSFSHGDGTSSYEPFPLCIEELKLSKTVTPLIDAGDNIDVTLDIVNHKPQTLTNVIITDELEAGQSYVAGSANTSEVSVNGQTITFELGDMAYLQEMTITYQVATDETNYSNRFWYDNAETNDNWFPLFVENNNFWGLSTANPYQGSSSWFVQDIPEKSKQILFTSGPITITGTRPVIQFWHSYDLEAGLDGGIVQVSTDGGVIYEDISDDMIREGYRRSISYTTFVIPNLQAYTGDSDGYINTFVDLSEYIGQDIYFRFYFASSETGANGGGWHVDNVELMDMKHYNSETCASSDQGDMVCVIADEEGTIVSSNTGSYTTSPNPNVNISIYPNPAEDMINLNIGSKVPQDVSVSIMTTDGREMLQRSLRVDNSIQSYQMNVADLAAGFYFIKVAAKDEVVVEKVIIN